MPEPHRGKYPANWSAIASRIKNAAGWKCERCGHDHSPKTGHTLTVAHLDNDKSNCADWNLAALCQRCHLKIQQTVDLRQGWMFPLPPWLKWRYEAWLEYHKEKQSVAV